VVDVRTVVVSIAIVLGLAACSAEAAPVGGDPTRPRSATPPSSDAGGDPSSPDDAASRDRVDPRANGLDVSLGEWAITLEAEPLRPGRVTFAVENRGTVAHGFEIEAEEGRQDNSGPGSSDEFKAETGLLQPAQRQRLTVSLAPGVYKFECIVDGHDDLGMEGLLTVRRGAPFVLEERSDAKAVRISGFAFADPSLEVAAGTRVSWVNDDPTEHTVTAEDGSFDSGPIAPGEGYAVRFADAGEYPYACAIHPDMRGTIMVSA
jgi:plastocyanin